jgi:4'-phosphopantetheinyl transferase
VAAIDAATNGCELDDSAGLAKHARMRMLTAADFADATPPVSLASDEIHIWLYADEEVLGAIDIVRSLLAAYLRVDRAAVAIERDDHGKPRLAQPVGTDLQFNLSHSGHSLIVALSRSQTLGIDIESGVRARPWLALAERYFTAEEYAALAALPAHRLRAAFLELWSCKEAVVKALGRGIAFGLDRLSFARTPDGGVERLVRIDAEAGSAHEWQIVRLSLAPELAGALAWRGPDRKLCAFRISAGATPA